MFEERGLWCRVRLRRATRHTDREPQRQDPPRGGNAGGAAVACRGERGREKRLLVHTTEESCQNGPRARATLTHTHRARTDARPPPHARCHAITIAVPCGGSCGASQSWHASSSAAARRHQRHLRITHLCTIWRSAVTTEPHWKWMEMSSTARGLSSRKMSPRNVRHRSFTRYWHGIFRAKTWWKQGHVLVMHLTVGHAQQKVQREWRLVVATVRKCTNGGRAPATRRS